MPTCGRELAVEVRRCPLRSRAGKEEEEKEEEEEEEEKEEKQPLIKSNNPHLAVGGEKHMKGMIRNVTRNETEMARTRKETLFFFYFYFCVCVYSHI